MADLEPDDPVVYALPRGGVPVGFEVARALRCPLDVLIVRKVGVPFQPELAMGAIAEGGVIVRNHEVIEVAGVSNSDFERVAADERLELENRVALFRGDTDQIDPIGHTAVVVDDGLATGSTALAAVSVLDQQGADAVWLAVPVAPASPLGQLEEIVDRLVILHRPRGFGAVGSWYRDFAQTTNDEVRALLARSRLA
ncbi:MAG TPA: phosphoribosyltransferase family protein [Acidimicrobiia bacterium]|nr:phosphoribosyltransferase family protein [Acidimicrobiia bacterium]